MTSGLKAAICRFWIVNAYRLIESIGKNLSNVCVVCARQERFRNRPAAERHCFLSYFCTERGLLGCLFMGQQFTNLGDSTEWNICSESHAKLGCTSALLFMVDGKFSTHVDIRMALSSSLEVARGKENSMISRVAKQSTLLNTMLLLDTPASSI